MIKKMIQITTNKKNNCFDKINFNSIDVDDNIKRRANGRAKGKDRLKMDNEYDTYRLSDKEEYLIRNWTIAPFPSGCRQAKIFCHVLRFLKEDGKKNGPFRGISKTHIEAFESMRMNINNQSTKLKNKNLLLDT